jgi:hypothetical protein
MMRMLMSVFTLIALATNPATGRAACSDPNAVATVRGRIDTQCDCAGAVSRTEYLGCASHVIGEALSDGSLPVQCVSAVKKCASKSTCGRAGYVTCLVAKPSGTRCSLKRNAALCTRLPGSCVGTTPFCCDGAGGCFGTTTTVPASTTTSVTFIGTTSTSAQTTIPTTTSTSLATTTSSLSTTSSSTTTLAPSTSSTSTSTSTSSSTSSSTTVPPPTTSTTTPAPSTTSSTVAATTTTSTSSSTSTLPPLVCTDPAVNAPAIGQVPVTIMPATANCGTAALATTPTAPFSGELDGPGGKLSDLGTGCLYVGTGDNFLLPPGKLPDGGTLILKVTGLNGTSATLGPSPGAGRADCTLPSGPARHCLNGDVGTDGHGACTVDTDCGVQAGGDSPVAGTCARDANCFFGPPLPIAVPDFPFFSTCVVNVFEQGACGSADLVAQTTTFSSGIAAHAYITADATTPCPVCVGGVCSGGQNIGLPCTPVGSAGTTNDCPPEARLFDGTLSVVLNGASTEPQQVAGPGGIFCPNQTSVGAFGRPDATLIKTQGSRLSPVGLLTNTAAATIAGGFCVPSTGVAVLDAATGFPGPGAVSVPVRINTTGLIALGLPPLLP